MSDGNLRSIFQNHLPMAFWQAIETWSTGQGVPDCHYIFPGGSSGWIENKLTGAWAIKFETGQVAWLERYSRNGGRCFVAVRRLAKAGPRRQAADELWLFRGADARALMTQGLKGPHPLGRWIGGPARWTWPEIRSILTE